MDLLTSDLCEITFSPSPPDNKKKQESSLSGPSWEPDPSSAQCSWTDFADCTLHINSLGNQFLPLFEQWPSVVTRSVFSNNTQSHKSYSITCCHCWDRQGAPAASKGCYPPMWNNNSHFYRGIVINSRHKGENLCCTALLLLATRKQPRSSQSKNRYVFLMHIFLAASYFWTLLNVLSSFIRQDQILSFPSQQNQRTSPNPKSSVVALCDKATSHASTLENDTQHQVLSSHQSSPRDWQWVWQLVGLASACWQLLHLTLAHTPIRTLPYFPHEITYGYLFHTKTF